MVDEIRDFFVPGAYYTKGIRRAIGVHKCNLIDEIITIFL